jgi:putative DNA primase/helicase
MCERMQCPPDFVAVAIMVALGSVLGRKLGIRPQARTNWTVIANQWAMAIGRPGVLKSPAMEAALAPVKRLQMRAAEQYEGALEAYRQAIKLAKLRGEAGEKAARKKLEKNPHADVSADLVLEEPAEPQMRRYLANDTTAAALGELLRQNPDGLLVFRDELVSLLRSLDREDQAEARGFYLTAWNGESAYTFDRIGRGFFLHIPAVCLSVLGSTQPGRIAEYLREAVRGGKGDDGLMQRFGLLVWPETSGPWREVDRWPDSAARQAAYEVFVRLAHMTPEDVGAQRDEDEAVPYLRFDPPALELFRTWREQLETLLRSAKHHPALEAHFAKYRKLIPGLALLCHIADGHGEAVGEEAMLRALSWAEYLDSHARRAYASVMHADRKAAHAILDKLRRGELPHTFAARDIYRQGWAQLSDRTQVQEALQLLVEYDSLAELTIATAGRSKHTYQVNPKALA